MKQKSPVIAGELKPNKRSAELNNLIRVAALSLDPKGSLAVLGERAGVGPEAIRKSIRRGYFAPGLASSIELAVGRKVLTREQLCPHKFNK